MIENLSKTIQLKAINDWKKEKEILEAVCRELWQAIVKARAGNQCEYYGCRCKGRLNAHHYKSKGAYPALRFDVDNGFSFCYPHHTGSSRNAAHLDPDFKDKILGKIEGYEAIRSESWLVMIDMRGNTIHKIDLKMEKLYLLQEAKKYKDNLSEEIIEKYQI